MRAPRRVWRSNASSTAATSAECATSGCYSSGESNFAQGSSSQETLASLSETAIWPSATQRSPT
jgi:hypothetical protein